VAPGTFRACSYADILAGSGFGSVETLLPVVAAWQVLLDLLRPDLIVADYSPILCLAAYGSVPVVAIGDGLSCLRLARTAIPDSGPETQDCRTSQP
jgi:rhamnosyltransferase subunit B